MPLSDLDTARLLPIFSLLTATISNLISPNGRRSFVEDVKSNILAFSPFRFGATATALVLELIGCRLLNIAEIHVTFGRLADENSLLDLELGFWSRFARRAFLIGVTLPLYMMLLASASYRWIQAFATLLVAEAVLSEILIFYRRTSFEVRRDWPHRVLLVKSLALSDHLNHGHFENESKSGEFEEKEEHENIPPPSALGDNLCDRVHQLRPPAAEPVKFASLENTPKLKKIFDPTVRAQWTCGHWRCLVYMVLHVTVRAVSSSWTIIELASTFWMLHCELQPVTLRVADKLSQSHLVYGLLSTLYQVGGLSLVVIFGYIIAGLLLNRLLMPLVTRLVTRLSKKSRVLQGIQQKFQDLAETTPITYNVLNFLRASFLRVTLTQGFMVYYFGQALAPLYRNFSPEKFSYIIEIIAIPTIQVMIYWLVCIVTRTEQAPQELESHFNAGQSSGPNIATDSDCKGAQNPVATDSRSTSSNEEEKVPKDGSVSSRTIKEFRLTIVRLATLVSTATIWIFCFL
ncbi:hypothetical protein N7510_008294 [Penicillium lagena]|uniref:uncharacterized protein n=1 Tax=Penicillium lagena TaxID=94218 RepID=UPI0025405E24|nr:uncharacterized protein N7510_008294 [Penicillium lagena]KAJ5605513.1 hypothetical protein N7510_008294 [Penicillium lagena]